MGCGVALFVVAACIPLYIDDSRWLPSRLHANIAWRVLVGIGWVTATIAAVLVAGAHVWVYWGERWWQRRQESKKGDRA